MINTDTAESVTWLPGQRDVTTRKGKIAIRVVFRIGHQYQVDVIALDGPQPAERVLAENVAIDDGEG